MQTTHLMPTLIQYRHSDIKTLTPPSEENSRALFDASRTTSDQILPYPRLSMQIY